MFDQSVSLKERAVKWAPNLERWDAGEVPLGLLIHCRRLPLPPWLPITTLLRPPARSRPVYQTPPSCGPPSGALSLSLSLRVYVLSLRAKGGPLSTYHVCVCVCVCVCVERSVIDAP